MSLAVLLGGLGVFLAHIRTPYAWTDEGVTYVTIHRSWPNLLRLWGGSDAPLLPYYMVAKAWVGLWGLVGDPGISLGRIRALSALAMALAAVLVQQLVARHRGQVVAVLAAASFIALPGVSRYAQEARPYAVLVLTATASWWAFDRWWARCALSGRTAALGGPAVDPPTSRAWLDAALVAMCVTLCMLMSLFGALQWVGLAVLAAWLTAPARRGQHGLWPGVRAWGLAWVRAVSPLIAAGVVVIWPVLHIAAHGAGAARPGATSLQGLAGVMASVVAVRWRPWWIVKVTGALVACSLLGLRDARRRRVTVAAWIWLLVPLALAIVLGRLEPHLVRERYWTPLLVPVAILTAFGAVEVGRVVGRWRPGKRWGDAIAAALVAIVVIASQPQQQAIRRSTGHDADLAPVLAAARKGERMHPGARVMITPNGASFYFAVPARHWFEHNLVMTPDPTSVNVWNALAPANERVARMAAAPAVVWIRYSPSTATPSAATFSQELSDAGLQKVSSAGFGGHWTVSVFTH